MARCPGCGGTASEACVCGWVDSEAIAVTGSGESGDEFSALPILDPAVTNILTYGVDGMRAEVPESILNPPRGRAYRTTNQAISDGVDTAIVFTDEDWDTDGMFTPGDDAAICVTPGTFHFSYSARFDGNGSTTGQELLRLRRNGAVLPGGAGQEQNPSPSATDSWSGSGSDDVVLEVGDTVDVDCFQSSGSPKNISGASMSWHYVGPTP